MTRREQAEIAKLEEASVERSTREGREVLEGVIREKLTKGDVRALADKTRGVTVSLSEVARAAEPKKLEATIGAFLRTALTRVEANGKPYYENFVTRYLQEALDDPSGYCGRALSSGLINEKTFAVLDKASKQDDKTARDFARFRIRSTLYKEQQEVFDDLYDSTMMIICSRRAGKTELDCRLMLQALLRGFPVLYLNKTVGNAISQTYDTVCSLLDDYADVLTVAEKSKADGMIKFAQLDCKETMPLQIRWAGMNDIASLDKLRGFHFGLVIIDEVGHIKNGDYLLNEVVTPMTADYKGSQIVLTGTPPRVKGFATKLWHSSHIRKFHWTAAVNPFINDFQAFIDRVCYEKGFTKPKLDPVTKRPLLDENGVAIEEPDYDIPFIQREYFGNMDAFDTDALVVPKYKTWHVDWNAVYKLGINKFIIGVDFGYVDFNAIVTIGFNDIEHKAYVFAQDAFGKAGDELIKARIKKAYAELASYDLPVQIVADTNQPSLVDDLYRKEGLPMTKAYKVDKATNIYETAGLLRTSVFIPDDRVNDEDINENRDGKGNILQFEFERTVWKRDEVTDNLTAEVDDDIFHPNAFHALRYALRNGTANWNTNYEGVDNVQVVNSSAVDNWQQIQQQQLSISYPEASESFTV